MICTFIDVSIERQIFKDEKRMLAILLAMLLINGCGSTLECDVNEENIEKKEQENEVEESEDLDSMYYDLACGAIDEKKYISALSYLYACNDYLDAEDRINELTIIINESRTGKSCFVSNVRQILAYIDENLNLQLMGTGIRV